MGKVRRSRQKYHLARAKSMNDISTIAGDDESPDGPKEQPQLPALSISSKLFDGIEIPLNCNQSLREEDARSIVTTKSSFKDRNLSKLQRRTLRHEAFMKKLDVIQSLKREARDRKKRQRTAITGDMRPLADALPPIEYVASPTGAKTAAPAARQRALPKTRQRQKNALEDISVFRRVLADPAYKTDPAGVISNYIQEKIQQELMDEV